jgi:hypothetical protein
MEGKIVEISTHYKRAPMAQKIYKKVLTFELFYLSLTAIYIL